MGAADFIAESHFHGEKRRHDNWASTAGAWSAA